MRNILLWTCLSLWAGLVVPSSGTELDTLNNTTNITSKTSRSDVLRVKFRGDEKHHEFDVTDYLYNSLAAGFLPTERNYAFADSINWLAEWSRHARAPFAKSNSTDLGSYFAETVLGWKGMECSLENRGCRNKPSLEFTQRSLPGQPERVRRADISIKAIDQWYQQGGRDLEVLERLEMDIKNVTCTDLATKFFHKTWKPKIGRATCAFLWMTMAPLLGVYGEYFIGVSLSNEIENYVHYVKPIQGSVEIPSPSGSLNLKEDAKDATRGKKVSKKGASTLDARSSAFVLQSLLADAEDKYLNKSPQRIVIVPYEMEAAFRTGSSLRGLSLSQVALSSLSMDLINTIKKEHTSHQIEDIELILGSHKPTEKEILDEVANRGEILRCHIQDKPMLARYAPGVPKIVVEDQKMPMGMVQHLFDEEPKNTKAVFEVRFGVDGHRPDKRDANAMAKFSAEKGVATDRAAQAQADFIHRRLAKFGMISEQNRNAKVVNGTQPVPKPSGAYEVDVSSAIFGNQVMGNACTNEWYEDNSEKNAEQCRQVMAPILEHFIESLRNYIGGSNDISKGLWTEGDVAPMFQDMLDIANTPRPGQKSVQKREEPDEPTAEMNLKYITIMNKIKSELVTKAWADQQCYMQCAHCVDDHDCSATNTNPGSSGWTCKKGCWNFHSKKLTGLYGRNEWRISNDTITADSIALYNADTNRTFNRDAFAIDLRNPGPNMGVRPVVSVCTNQRINTNGTEHEIPCSCGDAYGSETAAFWNSVSWRETAIGPQGMVGACYHNLAALGMARDAPGKYAVNMCNVYFDIVYQSEDAVDELEAAGPREDWFENKRFCDAAKYIRTRNLEASDEELNRRICHEFWQHDLRERKKYDKDEMHFQRVSWELAQGHACGRYKPNTIGVLIPPHGVRRLG